MDETDVIVAGHLCVDLHPKLHERPSIIPGRIAAVGGLRLLPGGCVVNTGAALAALGSTIRMVGLIGDDPIGRFLVDWVSRLRGVDPTGIRITGDAATSYSIVIQPTGEDRAIWHYTGANDLFDGHSSDLSGTRLLHLGYPPLLPAMYANDGANLVDVLRRARNADITTSVDMATPDPASAAGAVDWARFLERVVPEVDVLTPSLDDMRVMLGLRLESIADIREIAVDLIRAGAAIVMLTAGEHGVYLLTANADRFERGGAVLRALDPTWSERELWGGSVRSSVVTTTGAGDAAAAGLLHALLKGYEPEAAPRIANASAAATIRGHPFPSGELDVSDEIVYPDGIAWPEREAGILVGPADSTASRT